MAKLNLITMLKKCKVSLVQTTQTSNGMRMRSVVSFKTRPLFPRGGGPPVRSSLYKRLNGPRSRSQFSGEDKNCLHLSVTERCIVQSVAKALYQLRYVGTELIKSSVTPYLFNGSFNLSKRKLLMINLLFIANSITLNLPPNLKSHSAVQKIS